MELVGELEVLVWVFGLIVFGALILQWRTTALTVGLPGAYLISLGMVHAVGAFVNTIPAFAEARPAMIFFGFRECVVGALSFFIAAFFVAPLAVSRTRWFRVGTRGAPVPRFSTILLGTGIIFFVLIAPVLRRIPSIGALSVCGISLIMVAIGLNCWIAWQQKSYGRFLAYLSSIVCLPIVTLTALGFLSYGAAAALVVVSFVLTFFRPRFAAVAGLVLGGFVALSFYVTYMRERGEIREAVWGNEQLGSRGEAVMRIFTDFEWLTFTDEQLRRIDERLNQNMLVAAAMGNLEYGGEPFARGKTISDALLAVVPRMFWPDKPVIAGSANVVSEYTGIEFAEETSVGIGHVLEFYINFGTTGVVIGFFVLGLLLRLFDMFAAVHLKAGNYPGFAFWYLPGLGLLQTGGSLIELVGTTAASLVLMCGLRYLPFMKLRPVASSAAPPVASADLPTPQSEPK
jgi:hypothetical protein